MQDIKKEQIKNEIKDLLKDKKAKDAITILKSLNYPQEDDQLIIEILNEMIAECDLYLTKHNRYLNFFDSEYAKNLYKGYFQLAKDGYGFVLVDNLENDIYIPAPFKGSAMNNDLVLVNITKGETNTKNCEGKIIKILKRSNQSKVGEVIREKNKVFVLTNQKKAEKVLLNGETNQLVDGDLVTFKLLTTNDTKYPSGSFLKRIGHKNDPGIDIIAILAEHDFEVEFPKEVLMQLKTIKTEVSLSDLKNRRDLTNKMIFTIDGDDTKDIDDAISLEKLSNGNYQLGVHIADVSYYVKENSPLDKEAHKRATSVYLADRVVPMLPHQLSNGICSLNPNVLRLTISCLMEIDEKGNLINYDIFPSYIKSRKQMTYKKVNQLLEQGILPDDYIEFQDTLLLMQELAHIVRKNKISKGYIDFETSEAKLIVSKDGNVLDIEKRYQGEGEKIIEDFMILANEAVASYIYNMDLPGIYRVHGKVNDERLRKYLQILSNLNLNIKENLNNINQKTIQKIIKQVKNQKSAIVLLSYMISCMAKAIYQTENIGHFALGLKNYTHFTSPIRRYPDTITHRLLREYFFKEDGITLEKINHFSSILDEICLTSSERERASIDCEREVNKMKMAEFMENHIGEEYEGIVSGFAQNGMFVLLPNNLVEGMIRFDTMDDYYNYDSKKEMIVGSTTHQIYTIGSFLKVKVVSASKERREIDFIVKKELGNEEKKKVKKKH